MEFLSKGNHCRVLERLAIPVYTLPLDSCHSGGLAKVWSHSDLRVCDVPRKRSVNLSQERQALTTATVTTLCSLNLVLPISFAEVLNQFVVTVAVVTVCWSYEFGMLGSARRRGTAVFLLKIPEISIEGLDKSYISRWSPEVLITILRCFSPKSRPWNVKYKHRNYENGGTHGGALISTTIQNHLAKNILWKISFQSTKSGGGEQFLLLDCRAEAHLTGVFFHRHRYFWNFSGSGFRVVWKPLTDSCANRLRKTPPASTGEARRPPRRARRAHRRRHGQFLIVSIWTI